MDEGTAGKQDDSPPTSKGPKSEGMGTGDLALLVIASSGLVCILTWPERPVLPKYEYASPRNSSFVPGDGCPDLSVKTRREGLSERCRLAREEYRQATDDLIQQTRAADAAQAQAKLAYSASWASLIQAVGGILTLIAASFAAFYARQAAIEARGAAKAARKQLKLARYLGELELRPYLLLDKVEGKFQRNRVFIRSIIRNSGASIAKNVSISAELRVHLQGHDKVVLSNIASQTVRGIMARGEHECEVIQLDSDKFPQLKVFLDQKKAGMVLAITINYEDHFQKIRNTRQIYVLTLSALSEKYAPLRPYHIVRSEYVPRKAATRREVKTDGPVD